MSKISGIYFWMLFYFPIEYLGKTPQNTPHSTLCMEGTQIY